MHWVNEKSTLWLCCKHFHSHILAGKNEILVGFSVVYLNQQKRDTFFFPLKSHSFVHTTWIAVQLCFLTLSTPMTTVSENLECFKSKHRCLSCLTCCCIKSGVPTCFLICSFLFLICFFYFMFSCTVILQGIESKDEKSLFFFWKREKKRVEREAYWEWCCHAP